MAYSFVFFDPLAGFRSSQQALAQLYKNRVLCIELVKRDLGTQFAGQALGHFWIIAHPVILFSVYIFIFVVVLRVKIPSDMGMPRDYTLYILSGLVPWLSIQQALTRSTNVFIAQSNLVKQVVFPTIVLPFGAVLVSLVPLAIGLLTIAVYGGLTNQLSLLTIFLLPLAILLHVIFLAGIAFVLASVTPFIRDLKDIVVAFVTIGPYTVPAFFLMAWIPEQLRILIYLNPLSYVIWVYQDALYFGSMERPWAWVILLFLAVAAFALGSRIFHAIRAQIANVL
jgi:lipopolysaccharide transport system permease protein